MTASVEILTKTKNNVLSVPLAAVTTRNPDDDKKDDKDNDDQNDRNNRQVVDESKKQQKQEDKIVVFVNENGKAKMVEVKTGISDYDNIEIISGLTTSSEVVTGPFLVVSKRLKDGDEIVLKKKEDDEKDKDD
jgi:HlyD family secretion protein